MSASQIVVFELDKEEYGVEISSVQEIVRIPEIMRIPDVPAYIVGIINLRGKVIMVVDLKKKLGLGESQKHEESRLIVLNIAGQITGIMVDDVLEVLPLDERSIETLPPEIYGENAGCLRGIGRIENRLLLLLDVQKALAESMLHNNQKRGSAQDDSVVRS